MAAVVWRDEGPFPPAFDERPPLTRLQIVVMAAEPVEEIESRDLGLGVVLAMVVLQPGAGGAAFDRADRMAFSINSLALAGLAATPSHEKSTTFSQHGTVMPTIERMAGGAYDELITAGLDALVRHRPSGQGPSPAGSSDRMSTFSRRCQRAGFRADRVEQGGPVGFEGVRSLPL